MSYGNKGYQRGGFDGERSFGGPKPVEIGKEYDVQVTELSRQGDGIARIQGFVIFVKKSKVGEKTRIKVVNVGQRLASRYKWLHEKQLGEKMTPRQYELLSCNARDYFGNYAGYAQQYIYYHMRHNAGRKW